LPRPSLEEGGFTGGALFWSWSLEKISLEISNSGLKWLRKKGAFSNQQLFFLAESQEPKTQYEN
jgi:hypothetical protein